MGSFLDLGRLKKFVVKLCNPYTEKLSVSEIKKYLPTYLSEESYDILLEELKKFPDNSDKSYYTTSLNDHAELFQSDALDAMPFALLPSKQINDVPVMVLSNSCSMNPENESPYNDSIIYAPIHNLSKYLKSLEEELGYKDDQIRNYKYEIKHQKISSIFYLPSFGKFEESIVRLDYVSSCHISHIDKDEIPDKRLFSLSNVGFYLFLFKLSIHFTRILEKVDRDKGIVH